MGEIAPPDAPPRSDGASPTVSRCLNCGTSLQGPFCHACGQEGVDRNVSVGHLLRETLGDLFAFDGRFARTIGPLFTRPGALTAEFVAGHRVPYVPPVRLYVFSSFLLFLVAALLSLDAREIVDPAADAAVADSTSAVGRAEAAVADSVRLAERDSLAASGILTSPDSLASINVGDELDAASSGDSARSWFGAVYHRQKARIAENPEAYKQHLVGRISLLLFFLVPLFAAELKLLYLRRRVLYVQHVVFSLHVHAFAFLFVAVLMLLGRLWPGFWWLLLALPVYLFLAMRRTYGQSRLKTGVKEFLLTSMHFWTTNFAIMAYLLILTLLF